MKKRNCGFIAIFLAMGSCSYSSSNIIIKNQSIYAYKYYITSKSIKIDKPVPAFWDNPVGNKKERLNNLFIFKGESSLNESSEYIKQNKLEPAKKLLLSRINKLAINKKRLSEIKIYPYLLNNLAIVYLIQKDQKLAKHYIQNAGITNTNSSVAVKIKHNARTITALSLKLPNIVKYGHKKKKGKSNG